MDQDFFVYGTLMYPKVVAGLIGVVPQMCDATLSGYRRCRITAPDREAKGPVMIESPANKVEGKVLCDLTPSQVKILDLFEHAASGYRRVHGRARLRNGDVKGVDFYVATDDLREYLSEEDWSESDFEKYDYDWYVSERVPALLRAWRESGQID